MAEVNEHCTQYVKERLKVGGPTHVKCRICDREVRDNVDDGLAHWRAYHICMGCPERAYRLSSTRAITKMR